MKTIGALGRGRYTIQILLAVLIALAGSFNLLTVRASQAVSVTLDNVACPESYIALEPLPDSTRETKAWGYEYTLENHEKVQVGDSLSAQFEPSLKVLKWDGEVSFYVALQNTALVSGKDAKHAKLVEWTSALVNVLFYPIAPTANHEGAFEFEVVLKAPPASNVIAWDLITDGLEFFYQPPLTEEFSVGKEYSVVTETDVLDSEGQSVVHRPENVVGSYAVYHATKGNILPASEAEKYKTGKAFHIYRPLVWDAFERQVWADLLIDDGVLQITVPQSFLDSAVFPVVVDPTFGYTTAGGSQGSIDALDVFASGAGAPASSGTTDTMSIYSDLADTTDIYVGLYDDDTGPDALVSGSPVSNLAIGSYGAQWKVFTMGAISITGGATYWNSAQADTNDLDVYYDSVGGTNRYWDTDSSPAPGEGSWKDPFDADSSSGAKYSMYTTYTAAAACSANITNTGGNWSLGVVATSTTYWANGSEPTWPLVDGDAKWTVTNNSGGSVDINIKATNFTGGVGWSLGVPAENVVRLSAFEEGDGSGDGLTLTTSYQEMMNSLAGS
jgi:hypothetical protein